MIAVDTNVLVYAHREDSEWHTLARDSVAQLAEGLSRWSLLWPCVHEFLAVVTHPRIYEPPTPIKQALDQVDAWLESPTVTLLSEADGYWHELRTQLQLSHIAGGRVHDARIATLCLHHGVRELWTADRDFSRFPSLKIRNPLVR